MDSVKEINLTYYVNSIAVDAIPDAFYTCADSVMFIDLILTILLGAVLLAALVLVTDDWCTKQLRRKNVNAS